MVEGWNTTTPPRRRTAPAGVTVVSTGKESGKAYTRNHPAHHHLHRQECLPKTLSTPAQNGEAGRCKMDASKEGVASVDVAIQAFAITSAKARIDRARRLNSITRSADTTEAACATVTG
jgi:hypothetical protein